MKSFILVILLAVGLISCSSVSQVGVPQGADSVSVRVVTEGVVHRHIVRKSGPWNIHAVSIDLHRPEIDIVSARAFDSLKGREATSSIARRHARGGQQVIAAINADFFNMQTGENDLNQIIEEEIVKGVKKPLRAQFGLDDSRVPFIERLAFVGTAMTTDGQFSVEAVNVLVDSAVVVLNRFYHHYAGSDSERVVVLRTVRTSGDTVVTVARDTLSTGAEVRIDDSTLLLRSSTTKHQKWVAIDDTVRLLLDFFPGKGRIKTLVGGLPRIVRDGKNIAVADSMPGLTGKFTETRHPRTGVGYSKEGNVVYFVTVDGRQNSSIGMSLAEFAELMIEIGCYQGLNLDGGGSTAMVVDGMLVNSPSDGAGERPVANALLVVKKENAVWSR